MRSASPFGRSAFVRLGVFLLFSPIFAIIGAFVFGASVRRFVRWLRRLPSYWADTLDCPSGHPNAVASRWECGTCHGQYHGWVGRCSVCGSTEVEWFACETCHLAVVLPWRRRD